MGERGRREATLPKAESTVSWVCVPVPKTIPASLGDWVSVPLFLSSPFPQPRGEQSVHGGSGQATCCTLLFRAEASGDLYTKSPKRVTLAERKEWMMKTMVLGHECRSS